MQTLRTVAVFCFLSLAIFSCEKKEDSEKPKVNNLSVQRSSPDEPFNIGDTVRVSATFSDDMGLKSAFLYIHSSDQGPERLFEKQYDISGTNYSLSETFVIPEKVSSGEYVVEVRLVDEAGKYSTSTLEPPFQIASEASPKIKLTIPWDIEADETIHFRGTIEDDVDLMSVSFRMEIPVGYPGNQIYFEHFVDLSGPNDKVYNPENEGLSVSFPSSEKRGVYILTVTALDSHTNSSKREYHISY